MTEKVGVIRAFSSNGEGVGCQYDLKLLPITEVVGTITVFSTFKEVSCILTAMRGKIRAGGKYNRRH